MKVLEQFPTIERDGVLFFVNAKPGQLRACDNANRVVDVGHNIGWLLHAKAKRGAPAPFTVSGHPFAKYSTKREQMKGRLHKTMSLQTLLFVPDLVARAENSGCEACYVEVARWSFIRHRWERFAFAKFFGGEIKEFPDLGDEETCKKIADLINERQGGSPATMIHSFPSFGETQN